MSTFSVRFYVNGLLTGSDNGLSDKDAYNSAVPGEAVRPVPDSRWHVLMRVPALTKMKELLPGETLRICWQNHDDNLDTEHILIVRDNARENLRIRDNRAAMEEIQKNLNVINARIAMRNLRPNFNGNNVRNPCEYLA